MCNKKAGQIQVFFFRLPLASCCVWCRTAGVWGCSPCCGRPAAGWSAGISAWPGPSGRRWLEPPPGDPSLPAGAWGTRRPRLRADAWCVWTPLPPPQPTYKTGIRKRCRRRGLWSYFLEFPKAVSFIIYWTLTLITFQRKTSWGLKEYKPGSAEFHPMWNHVT